MGKNLEKSESGMKQHIDSKSTVLDVGGAEQPKLLCVQELSHFNLTFLPRNSVFTLTHCSVQLRPKLEEDLLRLKRT